MDALNKLLPLLGMKPVSNYQLTTKNMQKQILDAISTKVFKSKNYDQCDCKQIIEPLKEKFSKSDFKTKTQILTLFPPDWPVSKITQTFNCSNSLVFSARASRNEQGVLAKNHIKVSHRKISNEMTQIVKDVYRSDEASRATASSKECVIVRDDLNNKTYIQKRLLLSNLNETYTLFKQKYPSAKVSTTQTI